MTPEEKADDLVGDYTKLLQQKRLYVTKYSDFVNAAKVCALVFIDEVVGELKQFDNMDGYAQSRIDFWQQVKAVIENL